MAFALRSGCTDSLVLSRCTVQVVYVGHSAILPTLHNQTRNTAMRHGHVGQPGPR